MHIRPPPPRPRIDGADPRVLEAPPGRPVTPRRLFALLLLGGLVALPFGSRPLAAWAEHLPDWAGPLRDAAATWDTVAERAGLTVPYDTVHAWVREQIDRGF